MPAPDPTVFVPGSDVCLVRIAGRAYEADSADGLLAGIRLPLATGNERVVQVSSGWVIDHRHTLHTVMRIAKKNPLTLRHPFRDENFVVSVADVFSGKVMEPTEAGLAYKNVRMLSDGNVRGKVEDGSGNTITLEGPPKTLLHTVNDRHYLPVKMVISLGSERVVELPPVGGGPARRIVHHVLNLFPVQRKLGEFLHPVIRVDTSPIGEWADRIEVVAILPKYQAAVLEAERLTQLNAGTSNIYLAKSARRTVTEGK